MFFLLTFVLLHLLSSDFTSSHLLFICFSILRIVGGFLLKFSLNSSVTVQSRDGLDEQFSRVTVQSRNSTTNLAKKQKCRWLYLTIVFRASSTRWFTFRLRGIGIPCGVPKGIIFYFVNMLTTKYPSVNLCNSDAYFCEAFLLSGLADPAGGFVACGNSFWL